MENENKVEEKKVDNQETVAKTTAPSGVWKDKTAGCKEKFCAMWGKDKKTILAILALVILVAGSIAFKQFYKPTADIGPVAAKAKVQKFIDTNVPAGTTATIKDVVKEGDLYKVTIDVNKQEVPLYLTRDGKNLIQQLIDIDKASEKQSDTTNPAASADKTAPDQKQAVPDVKLFVMSFCPYGTQIEKGILPVLDALGSKIKFTLEFVDYSMHGANEIDENLRQYCIEKNQPTKLNAYLKCFLQVGQGTADSCMQTAGVNAAQVVSCTAQTDTQFSVKAAAADKTKWDNATYPPFNVNKDDNTKYGVQGSPTLVINGTTVSASRDPQSLLKAVCSGFTTAPKECSQALSATAPAPGFGSGTAAAGSTSGAACATPAQ